MSRKRLFYGLKVFYIAFFCGVIFFAYAYLYIDLNFSSKSNAAAGEVNNIPYERKMPDDAGIAFVFPNNSGALIYLDFGEMRISALLIEEISSKQAEYGGYPISYYSYAEYDFLADMIDRMGGLELEFSQEKLRYTGYQVLEYIFSKEDNEEIKLNILSALLGVIAQNGFSNKDFVFITENTETELTMPICYYWQDYIKDMCQRAKTIGLKEDEN